MLPSVPPSYAYAAATSPVACNNVPPSYTATGAASKEAAHPAGLPPPYSLGGVVKKDPAMTSEETDAFDMSKCFSRLHALICSTNSLMLYS